MIRHCVFLSLQADHDTAELAVVLQELAELCDVLAGASGFISGVNRDFEGKSADYPHGFTVDFADVAALERYANDARHQALGGRLVAQCTGGGAGITVFDIEGPAP